MKHRISVDLLHGQMKKFQTFWSLIMDLIFPQNGFLTKINYYFTNGWAFSKQ